MTKTFGAAILVIFTFMLGARYFEGETVVRGGSEVRVSRYEEAMAKFDDVLRAAGSTYSENAPNLLEI